MDLFLDPEQKRGATRALFVQLRDGILSGRFAAGRPVPASRELAGQLGVSRHTVTTVYGRLVAEGFIEGSAGGGTVVAAGRQNRRRAVRPAAIVPHRVVDVDTLGRLCTDAVTDTTCARDAGPPTVPARRVATVRHRRPAESCHRGTAIRPVSQSCGAPSRGGSVVPDRSSPRPSR